MMKLVVGLGNPGEKYRNNRHNVGRTVVDRMYNLKCKIYNWVKIGEADICKCGNFILAKAGGGKFMNESGEWVRKLKDFYKVDNKDIVVVYDDLDLEMGRVLVTDRGPKIHNGVNSVTEIIGEGFVHVRCGVDDRGGDRSVPGEVYVLEDFPDTVVRDELVGKVVGEVVRSLSN